MTPEFLFFFPIKSQPLPCVLLVFFIIVRCPVLCCTAAVLVVDTVPKVSTYRNINFEKVAIHHIEHALPYIPRHSRFFRPIPNENFNVRIEHRNFIDYLNG